jgi:uncharacterized protein YigA (DUF484 family)
MSTQKKPEYSSYEISDKDVVEFLEQNPDFFMDRESTLLKMRIAHTSGDAVSLLQYQTERLREQNANLRAKLMDLVNVARENDRLNERIHRLTLALIKTHSIDDIIDVLEELLHKEFHAQWVRLFLFDHNAIETFKHQDNIVTQDEHINTNFENFFKANRPLCGRLKKQQLEILFAEHADQVGSAVLLPLGSHGKIGMVAIGSNDGHRFHSSMGTIYLNQMADIISQALKRYL